MNSCPHCDNGEIYVEGALYRCACPLGERLGTPMHWPRDRNRERPYTIPIYPGSKIIKPSGRDAAAGKDE